MLSSPEILIAGASVVDTSGGRVDTPQWPGVFGPTGVQEQGEGTRGWLGNLRDPSVSTDMSGSGTGIPTPRSPRPCVGSLGANRTQGWYRQTKATKCGEKDGRESERLVVPWKRGNGPPGPVERRGRRVCGREGRNHAEGTEPHERVTATAEVV